MDNKITENLLAKVKKLGASDADILHMTSDSFSIDVLNGKTSDVESAYEGSISLRVLVNDKQAIVSSSNLSETALDKLAEQAVEMAKVAPSDKNLRMPSLAESLGRKTTNDDKIKNKDLQVREHNDFTNQLELDDMAEHHSLETLNEFALEAENAGVDISGVSQSGGASAHYQKSRIIFANSQGFHGSYGGSSYGISACMLAGSGTEKVRDYAYYTRRFHDDLPSALKVGTKAGERAINKLGGKSLNLGEVPVIFDRKISARLVGDFMSAISGTSIVNKMSFLQKKMGKQVFGDNIDIRCNPLLKRGLGSRPFDSEGVACQPFDLIKHGVLENWLLNIVTANKLKLQSNGNGTRAGGISSSNVYMRAGEASVDSIIADIKKGFFITGFMGGNSNILNGDYSSGAEGFLIENGKLTTPIHDVTIGGTLQDIFANLIPADDLKYDFSVNAPSLFVPKLTVSGLES